MIYFDRFDICAAYYIYACEYHSGQWSKLYEVLGRLGNIGFSAGPMLRYETLSENGKAIYNDLVNRKHLQ